MNYKGYIGHVEYDDEVRIFHGEVVGLRDVITFQGKSVDEIEQAFKDSIDDYLEWCKERGESPEKPYSGKILLRITPALHSKLVRMAQDEGLSLNKLLESFLENI